MDPQRVHEVIQKLKDWKSDAVTPQTFSTLDVVRSCSCYTSIYLYEQLHL